MLKKLINKIKDKYVNLNKITKIIILSIIILISSFLLLSKFYPSPLPWQNGKYRKIKGPVIPRSNPFMGKLSNGKILIYGGEWDGYVSSPRFYQPKNISVEIFDPKTEKFELKKGLNMEKQYDKSSSQIILPDDKLLIVGGPDKELKRHQTESKKVYLYDYKTDTFLELKDMLQKRNDPLLFPINKDEILILGGASVIVNENPEVRNFTGEIYNLKTQKSREIARYKGIDTWFDGRPKLTNSFYAFQLSNKDIFIFYNNKSIIYNPFANQYEQVKLDKSVTLDLDSFNKKDMWWNFYFNSFGNDEFWLRVGEGATQSYVLKPMSYYEFSIRNKIMYQSTFFNTNKPSPQIVDMVCNRYFVTIGWAEPFFIHTKDSKNGFLFDIKEEKKSALPRSYYRPEKQFAYEKNKFLIFDLHNNGVEVLQLNNKFLKGGKR